MPQLLDRSAKGRGAPPAFGVGREFLENRFVYVLFSPRAGGLTVGLNLNPDRRCNFDCVYCDVHRHGAQLGVAFDLDRMTSELEAVMDRIASGRLREWGSFRDLPEELLTLQHVALSGEGEPTLCACFAEVVRSVVHIRATGKFPFFKIVLLTNGSTLHEEEVQAGLRHLIVKDEVWLKLDVGTQQGFELINRASVPLARVMSNILAVGRVRPVVIQSLFPQLNGVEPTEGELESYIERLLELQAGGADISLVQIYSATRPTARSGCRHLPLKTLSRIAQQVRERSGLRVEVF